jgi:hypothetical protein
MFRYLDSLRKLGETLFKSMSSFVSISVLTLLFTVVFSIMGLHVYGEYSPDIGYPNFQTFLNSCVLIFQVQTFLNSPTTFVPYNYAQEGATATTFSLANNIKGSRALGLRLNPKI